METRIGRNTEHLQAVDRRLDQHDRLIAGIDIKLSEILATLARADGRRSMASHATHLLIALVAALAVYVVAYFPHNVR